MLVTFVVVELTIPLVFGSSRLPQFGDFAQQTRTARSGRPLAQRLLAAGRIGSQRSAGAPAQPNPIASDLGSIGTHQRSTADCDPALQASPTPHAHQRPATPGNSRTRKHFLFSSSIQTAIIIIRVHRDVYGLVLLWAVYQSNRDGSSAAPLGGRGGISPRRWLRSTDF